jgi:hypothetical protein
VVHRLAPVGHLVKARDKVKVLADGEVVPVREALRHVADAALDLGRLLEDVVAQAGAAAAVGREQPAHHADRRGLAAAVGAEEAEDLAARDLHGEIAHHVLIAEVLVQAAHVDGVVAVAVVRAAHGKVTSTGWPGRSLGPSAAAGRASTMKTSLSRVVLL